ncbi:PH domain-containing protein [Chloroflexus islandicus]|uniref:PH domain-containing protein n=1 Tax=Chloroflexus islandicus TaxID=1707952 RepID=UPI0009EE3A9F|nr:PH domain-containing protein [Chloroflexus islandicus]
MKLGNLIDKLLYEDADAALDLAENEQILYVTGRHWVILLSRLIIPLLGISFFGGIAIYRAIGGGFLVTETGEPTGFDLFNIILVLIEAVLMLFWVALWVRGGKDPNPGRVLLAANLAVLALIYFRYNGGRIFFIDPGRFFGQAFDPLNLLLIGLATISLFSIFFVVYDWLNDELILTNRRVVYDNDQVFIPKLLEQRVQQQIFIEEIQDVQAATKTYPQHWLKYGTIEVKSARIGGNIVFHGARNPKEMQRRIMTQVNENRRKRSEADLEKMVETRVYNEPPPKVKRPLPEARPSLGWLSWILPPNPEVQAEKETIIWRQHWLFLLQGIFPPLVMLFVGWILIVLLGSWGLLPPVWLTVLSIALVLAFLAWSAWEVEDYRNDMYILTPTNIIDVEKKPIGPEDRRAASLGAITNVSFETTFISNLLGYGNVVVETAGSGGKFTFTHVPNPRDVVTKINDYYVMFKRAEKERSLNDMLELLRHYHLAQQRHNEILPAQPNGATQIEPAPDATTKLLLPAGHETAPASAGQSPPATVELLPPQGNGTPPSNDDQQPRATEEQKST